VTQLGDVGVHHLGACAVDHTDGHHEHAHRDLGGVARRDRVHGVQMVVDEKTTPRYIGAG
jgi:hypothetical protein